MKRASRTAALVFGDQAIVSGTQFVTTVVLVRGLGLELFGVFSLLWLSVVIGTGLQQALVGQPLMAIAPKLEGEERRRYLGSVTMLELLYTLGCVATIGGCYAGVISHWDASYLAGTLVPLVVAVAARQLHGFVRTGFFVRGQRIHALVNDVLAYPGQLALLGYVALTGNLSFRTALWSIALPSAVAALVGLAIQRSWNGNLEDGRVAARRHWLSGRWLAAMQGLQFFASNSFLVVAAALLGTASVGAIKAAQTVMGVLNLALLAMENVVPIHAARESVHNGMQAFRRYLTHIGVKGLTVCGTISATIAVFPGWLLRPLYADEVSLELIFALRGFCLLYLCSFVIAVLQIGFRTIERTGPVFFAYAINTVIAVSLAGPVVSNFGFMGAVLGMVAQQVLMAGLLLGLFTRLSLRASVAGETCEAEGGGLRRVA